MARKTQKLPTYQLPDMPVDILAELLSDSIESIHRLPLRHYWLHKACELLETQLDQIVAVRPAAVMDD